MIKFPKQFSGSRNEILRIGHSLFSLSRGLERHVFVCACACAHSQVAMRGGPERARDEGRSTSERDVMVREEERDVHAWEEEKGIEGEGESNGCVEHVRREGRRKWDEDHRFANEREDKSVEEGIRLVREKEGSSQ